MRKEWIFIDKHPSVEEWLRGRPYNTRRKFAEYLRRFCAAVEIAPEEWRSMDRFEARDLAWKFIKPLSREHPATAKLALIGLKSFYRNKNGEILPFDAKKGGKHYIHVKHYKRAVEHIPNKAEMYQIVDMASSLRDKTMLLLLFQSGVRVNVLEHLCFGHVKDQLDRDVIVLKVTDELDHKLRSRDIPFYYTFLDGEGTETLRRYCEVRHRDSKSDTPLFPTGTDKPISQRWIWQIVKMCVKRAGFNPAAIWTHVIRKAFKKQVRHTENVEFEFKEMVMGHVIPGSRESYFDRHDLNWFVGEYRKFSFGREAVGSEALHLKEEMELRLRKKDFDIDVLRRELEEIKEILGNPVLIKLLEDLERK